MSNHRNDLLDLHPSAAIGSVLGGRPHQSAAAQDAEPETFEPRLGAFRRLLAAVRGRRSSAARAQTGRA